ncbi:MAG: UDP-N-acetylmuramate--L-alanine ligase [Clostridia bacterium]|nr:UDP-N-acetylmuramate--L-alanine ligase [Clostridia bacterium]
MCSLALMLKDNFFVSGSDRARSKITERLEENGIRVFYEHRAENVSGADAVVYTPAVAPDNPELAAARRAGIPTYLRAEILGGIMKSFGQRIGFSGSHGKSTSTAMAAKVFTEAGKDPTVVCGADVPEFGGTFRVGSGDSFIFEADEYRDAFLNFCPTTVTVLNIELDHTDYFPDLDALCRSFTRFAEKAEKVIYNADSEAAAKALSGLSGTSYAINRPALYTARNIGFDGMFPYADIYRGEEKASHVRLSVPGLHNIYNALACTAAAEANGTAPEEAAKGISAFRGIDRRFQKTGRLNGADVYIDYAHHPTEIKATLSTALRCGKPVRAVFEPHTYSRTAALFDDFVRAFDGCREVVFTDIYAARETNTFGVSSRQLADAAERGKYLSSYGEAAEYLRRTVKEEELLIIFGAGTINRLAEML